MPGAIQRRDLWRVLVCAAASNLSVHQACDQLKRAPSGPTVLGTLADQLGDLEVLEGQVNALLARLIPNGLGKRGRRVAIDLIALPYHGTVAESHQDGVCRSKAQGGPTHFFPSATADAVIRGRRYTLAICRVQAKQTMEHVVQTLLARLVTLGIRMKLLWLDRGFYSVRGMRELITGELPLASRWRACRRALGGDDQVAGDDLCPLRQGESARGEGPGGCGAPRRDAPPGCPVGLSRPAPLSPRPPVVRAGAAHACRRTGGPSPIGANLLVEKCLSDLSAACGNALRLCWSATTRPGRHWSLRLRGRSIITCNSRSRGQAKPPDFGSGGEPPIVADCIPL
jgi:hypothetical protein